MNGYSFAGLEALWSQAYENVTGQASPADLTATMAAIGAAESSFGTDLVNAQSGASGIWQILPSAHPQYDVAQLQSNPLYNAEAAVQVYQSEGLGAWETWTNGAAQAVLAANGGTSSTATAVAAPVTTASVASVATPPWAERAVIVIVVMLLAFMLVGAYRK